MLEFLEAAVVIVAAAVLGTLLLVSILVGVEKLTQRMGDPRIVITFTWRSKG